jgi:hypothetical protein
MSRGLFYTHYRGVKTLTLLGVEGKEETMFDRMIARELHKEREIELHRRAEIAMALQALRGGSAEVAKEQPSRSLHRWWNRAPRRLRTG